jgi:3-mercaptopyruvate sulfurtransferase SseA
MGNINGHETQITAPWLRMRLAEPETARRICLIDATPVVGARCLPGARALDLRALMVESGGMPTAEAFQATVRAIGATSLDQVIIYDRDDPLAASVLWRLFHAFGHRDACILAGGYRAWCAASGELAARYCVHEVGTWRARQAPATNHALLADIRRLQTA